MFGRFRLGGEVAASERRRAPREPVKLEAWILLENGRRIACLTANLSASGAKLIVGKSAILPGRFDVEVPARRVRRPALLVWRVGDELGVQFQVV